MSVLHIERNEYTKDKMKFLRFFFELLSVQRYSRLEVVIPLKFGINQGHSGEYIKSSHKTAHIFVIANLRRLLIISRGLNHFKSQIRDTANLAAFNLCILRKHNRGIYSQKVYSHWQIGSSLEIVF